MPVLPIFSGCRGRPKEIMFAKMVYGNTFRTIRCHINVGRWHGIGHWGWIKDHVMETLKSK